MGRNTKLTVRAQRKYAHKAYIPGLPVKNEAEPPEQEQIVPPQPALIKARKKVGDILDRIAFRSIHGHIEEQMKLILDNSKNVRVVLKRYKPEDNSNISDLPQVKRKRRQEPSTSKSPQVHEELKDRKRTCNRPYKTRAAPVSPAKETMNVDKNTGNKPNKTQTSPSSTVKEIINKEKTVVNRPNKIDTSQKNRSHTNRSQIPLLYKEVVTNKINKAKKINKKTRQRSTSQFIESLKPLILRERVITRNWISENKAKESMLAAKNNPSHVPQRRVSETSAEDNRPLTYFLKKKNQPVFELPTSNQDLLIPVAYKRFNLRTSTTRKVAKKRKPSKVRTKKKRPRKVAQKKGHCSKADNKNGNPVVAPARTATADIQLAVIDEEDTLEGTELVTDNIGPIAQSQITIGNIGSVMEKQMTYDDAGSVVKSECTQDNEMPVNSVENQFTVNDTGDERNLDIPSVSLEVMKIEESEYPMTIEETVKNGLENNIRPNPLADFVIKIFNYTKFDYYQPDHRELNMRDSVERVKEWLVRNNEQNSPEFKVPNTPRRRAASRRVSSVASSNRSTVIDISCKELNLRTHCPTWNYKTLSEVARDKNIVRRFCGVCTRCTVIFKLQLLQRSAPIESRPASCQISDIYEFTSNADDEPSTSLVRESNIEIFNKISRERDHLAKLKELMTDRGRKIFRAARIIDGKVEANEPLLPGEHNTLAQVIGILNECNAARIPDSLLRSSQLILQPRASSSQQSRRPDSPERPAPTRPVHNASNSMRESIRFKPTAEEFLQNPIVFASKMKKQHPSISLCGIKPPQSFEPTSSKGDLEVTFKTSNQYIHRMLNRWGTATRQLTAIRSIQDPKIQRSPLFEGLEVDLVKLFLTVQSEEGIEACQNNNEKWQVVAQKMKLYCRGKVNTKLENIYLKYLLGYNTLTPKEREKANTDVETTWKQREIKCVVRAQHPLWRQERMQNGLPIEDDDEEDPSHLEKVCAEAEECVTPGRVMNYNSFNKLGLQVKETYFPDNPNPSPEEVEKEYWRVVMSASAHVCVHYASVDAAEHNRGFTDVSTDPYATHPWNLKRLRCSSANLLSYLGPTLGVSSTSIHYGMMFSTSCWHMDPTSVPWIEYLHSGPPKIWYSISSDQEDKFRAAAEALCPFAVQNKSIWLPCDIIMIPPNLLRRYGVVVERHVQFPGEYVIVYPNTYCASIDTGLTVSEGVYFAPYSWILDVERIFLNLRSSCEPSLFSIEKLLIAMAQSETAPFSLLRRAHTVLTSLLCAELGSRKGLADRSIELMTPEVFLEQNQRATRSSWQIQPSGECAYCRCHLHLSKVIGIPEGNTAVCALHGVLLFEKAIARRVQLSNVYCIVLVSNTQIYEILNNLKQRMMRSIVAPV